MKYLILLFFALLMGGCAARQTPSLVEVDPAVDAVRPVVTALLSGDVPALRAMLQFTHAACTTAQGLGGPPKCPPDYAEGTILQVLPLGGPEGTYATPQNIDPLLSDLVNGLDALYAVYRVPASANPPDGELGLIFTRRQNGVTMPVVVRTAGGKIVRIDYPPTPDLPALLEGIPAEDVLLPPDSVEDWMEE